MSWRKTVQDALLLQLQLYSTFPVLYCTRPRIKQPVMLGCAKKNRHRAKHTRITLIMNKYSLVKEPENIYFISAGSISIAHGSFLSPTK